MVYRPTEYEALYRVEKYLISKKIAKQIGQAHWECQKHEIACMTTVRGRVTKEERYKYVAMKTGFTAEHVEKMLIELTRYLLGVS